MGVVKNVRERGDGPSATGISAPPHPLAENVFWDAEHAPRNLGFSIKGPGDKRREGRRVIVESLELDSVDLVSRPATTGGLREGRVTAMKRKPSEVIEATKAKRPAYARFLREQAEAGVLSPDMGMDEPELPAEELPPEGADHEQAIRDACKAVHRRRLA